MTTPYTWSTLQTAVATALVQQPYNSPPADFTSLFPDATGYAEGRIARDLVLLNTRGEQTCTISSGARSIVLNNSSGLTAPSGLTLPVVTVEGIALSQGGALYHYEKASLDTIDLIWPQQNLTLAPAAADWIGRYWAMLSDLTVVLCPTVDANYAATVTGLFVQSPLSNSNQNTYIASVYGDLMFCAVMIFMSGALLRNFGAQADEPRSAQSWEAQYAELLTGAKAEEARRRGLVPDVEAPPAQAAR